MVLCGPGSVSAQSPRTADGHRVDLVDSASVLVATTLSISSGTADDPLRSEGLTFILAEAHRISLEDVPGVLRVETHVDRSTLTWTVLSTPAAADAALRSLQSADVMLRGLPTAIEEARRRFVFTATTPTAEVEAEAAGLFAGFGSPWSRPLRGTPETVSTIDARAARDRWTDLFEHETALVRVAPPDTGLDPAASPDGIPPTSNADTVDTVLPSARDSTGADADPFGATATEFAWSTPDRLRITRDVTNVWIVAGFPIPSDLDRTTRDHLLHRIGEILDPVPGDPGTIGAGAEVIHLPAGDVLVVRLTTLPFAAARWEERIRSLPSGITPPFDPEFFRWERRRFRAHLLLQDASAGPRSRRVARDLLETGAVRALEEEAWELAPDDLADAAGRLGPPRILVFGPDVDGDDPRP